MLKRNYWIIFSISLAMVMALGYLPNIPQDPNYHLFADQRVFFGIPNFIDVISSIPYLLVGLVAGLFIFRQSSLPILHSIRHIYIIFFISVALIFFGSAYYHLNPDNSTLLWDRLPMSLAFMSFFTIIIAEYIAEKPAKQLYFPLLLLGLTSALYWFWTETLGRGDLRLYILVQFLPVILIPVILYLFAPRFTHGYYFLLIVGCYILAKLFELGDQLIFDTLGFVSGHTLKHLVSAAGPYLFYVLLKKRASIDGG